MSPRDRLLQAIQGQPVDRVPISLYEVHDCGGDVFVSALSGPLRGMIQPVKVVYRG